MTHNEDIKFMRTAIALGLKGQGRTADNPCVGAVVVKEDEDKYPAIIGAGRTDDGGRPHAEVVALKEAGERARGATLFVTLEPCAHIGRSPPCVDAVLKAGIKRVVIGIIDPDERTAYQSVEKLKRHGVEVLTNICAPEVRRALAGHIFRITEERPFITVKMAMTQNYKVAYGNGQALKVTGADTNDFTHLLRATHDAIAVGYQTFVKDKPRLNVRLKGLEQHSPRKFLLLDKRPFEADISGFTPVYIDDWGQLDIEKAFQQLKNEGVNRLFIEAGPSTFAHIVKNAYADRVILYQSQQQADENAMSAYKTGFDFTVDDIHGYTKTREIKFENDIASVFWKKSPYFDAINPKYFFGYEEF